MKTLRNPITLMHLGAIIGLSIPLCLVSCGGSDEKNGDQGSSENTPAVKDLSWCAENGDLNGVKSFLNTGNINGADGQKPPLHLAAGGGHRDVVEFLVSQGANINETDSSLGWSPVHYAASSGHAEMVALLIQMGAKFDISDGRGDCPIHIAASQGHLDVVKTLLAAGAPPDQESRSPSGDNQRTSIASEVRGFNASDNYQPIHAAAAGNQSKVVKFFIGLGISPEAKDGNGHNVLHYATKKWGWGEDRAETIRLVDPGGSFESASKESISTEGYYVTDESTPKYIRFMPEELVTYKGSDEVFPTRRAVVSLGPKGGTRPGDVSKWLSPANEEAKKQGGFITGRYKLMGTNVPFEITEGRDPLSIISFSRVDNQLQISIESRQEAYFPDPGSSGPRGTNCRFVSWK
jgi:hypothetical protein